MANRYAANFGDVVKHLVLCAALERTQPRRYLESHGGRLEYELATLQPGPGGVSDFLAAAHGDASLAASSYARLLRSLAGGEQAPGIYPGSIALADAVLDAGAEVVAFELVEASAESLRDGLARRGRTARIFVGDGLAGAAAEAGAGDLVLLDPFHVHERGMRLDSAEAFSEIAGSGATALLWYALYEPGETAAWAEAIAAGAEAPLWQATFVGASAQAGLAGCGFLGAGLDEETAMELTRLCLALGPALEPYRPGLTVLAG